QRGQQDITFIWQQKVRRGKIYYQVNRDHPLVNAAERAGGPKVRNMLRLIEETVPIPTITHDWALDPTQHAAPFEGSPKGDIQSSLNETYRCLLAAGVVSSEAILRLLNIEPFNHYP